jgi:Na+/H+-dicarboxylate symporter
MKRFYYVTFALMFIGLFVLCLYAPWTQPETNSPNLHQTIGYAPVWSQTFAQIPAAHVDWSGAFAAYAVAIIFFSIVLGAIVYFFRERRGKPATHRVKSN